MGKVTRIKGELEEVASLLEIITVMKDVSTNRFFVFSQNKKSYRKFFDILMHFFHLIADAESDCPLVKNDHPGVDILVVTSEQSFMSGLNGKVSATALAEYQKYPDARLICVGPKGAEKCRSMGMRVEKVFPDGENHYDLAKHLRDYLIDRVVTGKTGKVVVIYMWAKNFSLLKPQVITLLPASDMVAEAIAAKKNEKHDSKEPEIIRHDFIHETSVGDIVTNLANIWVHTHLFEISNEKSIVESAAQAQQLDAAIEGLSSEYRGLKISFRKAGREKLNQAMREVFTASNMMKRKQGKKVAV